jgi:SulP family sulfate permease
MTAAPALHAPALSLPTLSFPAHADFGTAFLLLVVPQLPLTFGNAIVAVTDVARTGFGDAASRVTPARVCISCGAGNVVSAIVGGVPMCHGAGGLTAHMRLGARTKWMNVGLGSAFIVLGLLFGDQVPALLGTLPVWALAGFLAYAGVRHALLVADLRGAQLAVALFAGGVGAWRGNLAYTVAIGLIYAAISRVRRAAIERRDRSKVALHGSQTR